jgi:hypothetical protein
MTRDELTAIRERLASDPQRCPFDYPDCKVRPDEPCPVCGDVDDLDVPVEEHKPSRCVANNTRLLRDDLAALLQHVEALEGAMAANDERLRAAEARVWPDGLTYGCDAADYMADEVLGLRSLVEALEQRTKTAELHGRDCRKALASLNEAIAALSPSAPAGERGTEGETR